ncbi:MAG: hypothetical protein R3246_09600 [Acidimicrobiia bacterium]|nr:hypothetical protein [Acidimicrobiia bacterium]
MFVQVLQGTVRDPDAVRARVDEWNERLGPTADGWLGTTEGATDDGTYLAVVRFRDEEAARRNSERPEQTAWWNTVKPLFDEVEFHDYVNTATMLGGGSDDAGFVQIIQGTYRGDRDPAEMSPDDPKMAEVRPDVLGGLMAFDDSGHFTQTVYFTSEEAAREGEQAMASETEMAEEMNEWMAAVEGLTFFDLRSPRMTSP